MSNAVQVCIIGAGSAQFSMGMVKDLCLTEGLAGSHITFMDIDEDRLDMIYRLGTRYAQQLGAPLTFDKTTNRAAALQDADFVINTAYVLGHTVEADMRKLAGDKYGYYHSGGQIGRYHQLRLMLDVAQDMERICPDAWLIQVGNPVFDGCTLMTRETSIKVCGLCHGHYGYLEIASTIGLSPDQVTWQAPGLNHNIWLTHFIYQGQDAYPLIDEWIATRAEDYWRTHVAQRTHDAQMSRGAVHQYHLYGLFPIGDTVRRGGWWYHTDIDAKKRWYGEPWGGPDTHLARPFFVSDLEKRIVEMTRLANDPRADLLAFAGKEKTREQIAPIIDGLINNREGMFQVNVPNRGAIDGLPDNLVVEVPAVINQKGIQPLHVGSLPPKIMVGHILPDWLETERELLAFKTGDRSLLLWNVLDQHQTRSYDQAVAILDELMELDEVKHVEDWEKMQRIADHYKYPAGLREYDGFTGEKQ
jgi:alpha-galactosidase